MALEGFTDRAFSILQSDVELTTRDKNKITNSDIARLDPATGLTTATNIRDFFIDPTTGKRVEVKALDRIAREAIRRSNRHGITVDGKPTVDLKKMSPSERRSWVTANNVGHWLDDKGDLRTPEARAEVEATMSHQSMVDLDQFRNDNPNLIRTKKDVKKGKDGNTTVIDGVFSPGELTAMLQNPGLPENVKSTILAYSKAVYRQDGKLGLMQGMYSGESKETVYTPNSTPSLRDWGSPLLQPEHRALLPLSMSVTWETDASGLTKKAAVRVNGLDWKAVDKRVLIAAGSDLAVQHGITVTDLYGFMNEYVVNLNKGNGNANPNDNAVPSARLFDPRADGTISQKGENIRDLMHFIFDFQKKKSDAYINQPADWGELGLRGPTHPYTSFRADRWTSPEASDNAAFIRVSEAAYTLRQGNFMGDGTPKRKLNRKDVSETTPAREAEAQRRVVGETPDLPPLREPGKVVDPMEALPPNRADLVGRISDLYAKDGEVLPPLMLKWLDEYEHRFIARPPKNLFEFGRDFEMFIDSDAKDGRKGSKNQQDRAQYFKPIIAEFNKKIRGLTEAAELKTAEAKAEQARLDKEAATASNTADDAARATPSKKLASDSDAAAAVQTPMSDAVRKDLAAANDQILMWREHVDDGIKDKDSEMSLAATELPFYKKELRKYLNKAFELKADFDPGFDIYQYLPDYEKPPLRSDIQTIVDREAATRRAAEVAGRPTGAADPKVVSDLSDSAQNALSAIRVLRKDGVKDMPNDIKDYFMGSNKVGVGIEKLFEVMSGKKGTIDYTYNAQLASGYVAGIDALMKANDKKIIAAKNNQDRAEVSWREQNQAKMEELKSTVAGIGEYAQSIADSARAKA
jgi:hypothetical protein